MEATPAAKDFVAKVSSGEYIIAKPDTRFNIESIIGNSALMSHPAYGQAQDFVNKQLQNVSNVQNYNNNNPVVSYNIGEIILTERVDNGDAFLQQLNDKVNGLHPITKNMRVY